MSTLYLIRHGQASFGAANYDVLSPLGVTQAQRLGEHLASYDFPLDAIYSGPRQRQLDTARHLIDAARAAGRELPELEILDAFDEYPAFELLKHWVPVLQAEDAEFREILGGTAPKQQYERAFELIVSRWVRGELDTGDIESFQSFCHRVEGALRVVMQAQGAKKHVAVVTSGGPISVTVRHTLGLADEMMIKVAWVVANASISEFRYRGTELTLVGFNSFTHLRRDDLVTYR